MLAFCSDWQLLVFFLTRIVVIRKWFIQICPFFCYWMCRLAQNNKLLVRKPLWAWDSDSDGWPLFKFWYKSKKTWRPLRLLSEFEGSVCLDTLRFFSEASQHVATRYWQTCWHVSSQLTPSSSFLETMLWLLSLIK